MNDQAPATIPPIETPSASDTAAAEMERDSLDKAARSAPWRDAYERQQHTANLNKRIDVLQSKLDKTEDSLAEKNRELQRLTATAEVLQHSCDLSKILVRDGTVICVVGGGLVSVGGLFAESEVRFLLAGLGGAFLVCGLWICKVLNRNAFPE